MKEHTQYAEGLALYALGALDNAQERAELEAHLSSCRECQEELAVLRGDAALLSLSTVGPTPPQRSLQRLLDAIGKEPRTVSAPHRSVLGVLRPRWLNIVPIAATLLLAIFSLMLLSRNSRLMDRVEGLRADVQRLQAQVQEQNESLAKARELYEFLHSTDLVPVTLTQVKKPVQPQVKTMYSPQKGRLFLVASNLEPLPPDKVYELWLVPASGGAPMPCGTFKPDPKGGAMMDHKLESTGVPAKAFAITIEPASGSPAPTSPIMMIGNG